MVFHPGSILHAAMGWKDVQFRIAVHRGKGVLGKFRETGWARNGAREPWSARLHGMLGDGSWSVSVRSTVVPFDGV